MKNDAAMLLDDALSPLADDLASPRIEDVAINGPGGWWARSPSGWEWRECQALDFDTLDGIGMLLGSLRRQNFGRSRPFVRGELHTGHRFQVVGPPAVPEGTISITLRRPSDEISPMEDIPKRYDTSRFNQWAGRREQRRQDSAELLALFDKVDVVGFLRAFVRSRRTAVLLGPTGAGKTFLSKTLLADADPGLRLVTIEDALEMALRHRNAVRLLFGGATSDDAEVTPNDCHHAALRMRPDIIPVQELRDPASAWVYVNEIVLAHPGSPTTTHGETAPQGARRVFGLLKGSEEGKSIGDGVLLDMMGTAIDAFIPISTDGTLRRQLGEVWFADDAARRGETMADLLRAP